MRIQRKMSLTVFRRESLVPVLDGIRRFNRSIRQKRKNGWHRALYNPNRLLRVFRTLKLRDGYRLAAGALAPGDGFPGARN